MESGMENEGIDARIRALAGLCGELLRALVETGALTPQGVKVIVSAAGGITAAASHPDAQKMLTGVLEHAGRARPPE